MKTVFVTAVALAALATSSAYAADDSARIAAEVCSKCHGNQGISNSALFPNLAGQQAGYIEQQLMNFRDRSRGDPHAQAYMWGVAGPLRDSQIKDLARYYAAKPGPKPTPADDAALAAKGKTIYDEGVPANDVPACVACHGPDAEGNDTIPRLASQHPDYIVRQIRQYRDTLRENELMHENVKKMTEEEAEAVAAYVRSK